MRLNMPAVRCANYIIGIALGAVAVGASLYGLGWLLHEYAPFLLFAVYITIVIIAVAWFMLYWIVLDSVPVRFRTPRGSRDDADVGRPDV